MEKHPAFDPEPSRTNPVTLQPLKNTKIISRSIVHLSKFHGEDSTHPKTNMPILEHGIHQEYPSRIPNRKLEKTHKGTKHKFPKEALGKFWEHQNPQSEKNCEQYQKF
jgi:hypothetical protein